MYSTRVLLSIFVIIVLFSSCSSDNISTNYLSVEDKLHFVNSIGAGNIVYETIERNEVKYDTWSRIFDNLEEGKALQEVLNEITDVDVRNKAFSFFREFQLFYVQRKDLIDNWILQEDFTSFTMKFSSSSRGFAQCKQKCEDIYEDCKSNALSSGVVTFGAWTEVGIVATGYSLNPGFMAVGLAAGVVGGGLTYVAKRHACKRSYETCMSYCTI